MKEKSLHIIIFEKQPIRIGGATLTNPKKPGSKKLPDFNKLTDRIIAETRTSGPSLVIKTNLDPQDSTVNNPYFENKKLTDTDEFRNFFEDDSIK